VAKYINLNNFNFAVGDTIAVHHKVREGSKERVQIFEGIVIAIKGRQPENKSFTVRKIAAAEIGVERIWPISCPSIEKIKVKKKGKTRRAKLYYLRYRKGKGALKIEEKLKPKQEKDASAKARPAGRSAGQKNSA